MPDSLFWPVAWTLATLGAAGFALLTVWLIDILEEGPAQ